MGFPLRVVVVLLVLALVPGTALGARAEGPQIKGYEIVGRRTLARGLAYYSLRNRSGTQSVRVAILRKDAPLVLRLAVARNRFAGPSPRLERTSAMCRRNRCLLGVNGAFFNRRSGLPNGALVSNGEPMHWHPRLNKPQLMWRKGARPRIGTLDIQGKLSAAYPRYAAAAGIVLGPRRDAHRIVRIRGVNAAPPRDSVSMYTQRYGRARAPGRSGGADLVLRAVKKSRWPPRVGDAVTVRPVALRTGRRSAAIPTRGVVLQGRGDGARALVRMWNDVRKKKARPNLKLSLSSGSSSVSESVAGRPVLLRKGRIVAPSRGYFAGSRQPRTVIGWNKAGDVLFVTIDGRARRARGMSLRAAASLLRALGATDALNLDGGGSTTMVAKNRIANRPSGGHGGRSGHERPVATALLVVPKR